MDSWHQDKGSVIVAEVQWIKLKVGMFDGNSFKRIKRAKIGGESYRDKLTAIWFELMDFAGKCNHSGQLIDSKEIPFTSIDDIAIMIDREREELELCMQFYLKEGMVEIIDDIYMLSNWTQYQNEAGLEKIREQKRLAQQRWRDKKALKESNVDAKTSTVESTVESTYHLPSIIEEDKEEDKEKEYHSFYHSAQKRKTMMGSLSNGLIVMSDEQFDDLCEKLSYEEIEHYFGVIRDCEAKGKSFKKKTHYQAILDMAEKDRKIIKTESVEK